MKKMFRMWMMVLALLGAVNLALTGCDSASVKDAVSKVAESAKKTQEPAQGRISAKVVKVVDGDTIKVNVQGKEDTVRFLLVDTPETKHPEKPVQPFGPEASKFTTDLLTGK